MRFSHVGPFTKETFGRWFISSFKGPDIMSCGATATIDFQSEMGTLQVPVEKGKRPGHFPTDFMESYSQMSFTIQE